jgi:hypothetical protein
MAIPTSQDLRAKISPEARSTEPANWLEHLKSSLERVYQLVRKKQPEIT